MAEEKPGQLTSLVPEFYYDLIARIVPGALLFLALCWENRGSIEAALKISSAILLPIGFVISYTLGHVIIVTADWTLGEFNRYLFRWLSRRTKNEVWVTPTFRSIRTVDSKQMEKNQYALLIKMVAEKNMLRSVLIVWFLSWFLGFSFLLTFTLWEKLIVSLLLTVGYYRWEWVTRREVRRIMK